MHDEVIGQEAHEEGDPNYMVHPHQQTMLLFFNLAKLNMYDHLLFSLLCDNVDLIRTYIYLSLVYVVWKGHKKTCIVWAS